MLRAAEARREGFGAIRTTRNPLPMCRTEVEQCYDHRGELGCVNPEFSELPEGRAHVPRLHDAAARAHLEITPAARYH